MEKMVLRIPFIFQQTVKKTKNKNEMCLREWGDCMDSL